MNLDTPTQTRLSLIYPDVATQAIRVYEDMFRLHSRAMRCAQGLRTWANQDKLYAQGRAEPGNIVTHARGGESDHNFGCAFDSCFSGDDPWLLKDSESYYLWQEYGKLCVAHGLTWGGNWSGVRQDRPHAAQTYGLSLPELATLYKAGGLRGVWTRFDQIRGVEVGREWGRSGALLLELS